MHRFVSQLRWAQCAAKGPFDKPRRISGRKRAGLKYESDLAKRLPQALHGQWINFADANGPGWAQPDFLVEFAFSDAMLILETKYTWVAEAYSQIEHLYKPLVEHIWRKPAFGVVVAKVLTPDCKALPVYRSLDEAALAACSEGKTVLWHWIGSGPLFSQQVTEAPARALSRARKDAQHDAN